MTFRSLITGSGLALPGVALAALVSWLLAGVLPQASLTMPFLAAVLFVASRTGLVPALATALLAFFVINYFFTEPRFTLHVDSAQDVANLVLFLLVAGVTGSLGGATRREADENAANIHKLSVLIEFSKRMLGALDQTDVLSRLATELHSATPASWALISADEPGTPVILHQSSNRLGRAGQLGSIWSHAGSAASTSPGFALYPLVNGSGKVALLVVESRSDEIDGLVNSLCQQASAALERIRLAEGLAAANLETETEQLRSALLSSVSHDLRTPLASIIGSTSSLRELDDSLQAEDRTSLLDNVLAEARRLDRYIQNLLDMTRLGRGRIPLHRDWVDVRDLVSSALARVRPAPDAAPPVDVKIAADTPLLWIHGALIEQVLVNLVDNALRYSPQEGRVRLTVRFTAPTVTFEVEDEGIGIPEALRDKVFDMFYRVQEGDRSGPSGTGLGLAICKGMVNAHHGSIVALPGAGGKGTCMRVTLPVAPPQPEASA